MKQASGKAQEQIRVAVRVRPPLDNEIHQGNSFDKLNIDGPNKLIK